MIYTEWGAASIKTYTVAKSRNYGRSRRAAEEFINTGDNWRKFYLAQRQVHSGGGPATDWIGHEDD